MRTGRRPRWSMSAVWASPRPAAHGPPVSTTPPRECGRASSHHAGRLGRSRAQQANLFFVLGAYHPQPPYWNETAPGAGDGWQWRLVQHDAAQAWREICEANANVAMIDGYKLSTHEEFTANAWYADPTYPGGDQAHLTIEGYRAWGDACAEALLRACDCGPSVDFDADGRRTVADIFDFLAAWFAGSARADFDRSGGAPAPSDIFAFLNAWFSGCAGH